MGKFSKAGHKTSLMAGFLVSALVLTGCGNSRLNPMNWFGRSRSEVVVAPSTNPLIPTKKGFRRAKAGYSGRAVDQITGLVIERVPGGALIQITGLAATQGSYDVLVEPDNKDELPVDGVLTYTLKARLPARPQGAPATREINAGHFITDQQLEGVRSIRVLGARNSHTVRRR